MTTPCDTTAERLALGEPLGEHADTCDHCKAIIALQTTLAGSHREVDPGLGFASRMTAGAQHRIVVRRRRKLAGIAAASTLAASLGVFVMTRTSHDDVVVPPLPATEAKQESQPEPGEVAADTAMLVHYARTDRSSRLSADWGKIEKPLRPYRSVLKGLTP